MEKLIKKIRNKLKRMHRKQIENYCNDFYNQKEEESYNDAVGREELEDHFMRSIDVNFNKEDKIKFLQTILSDLQNNTQNYRKFYENKRNVKQ
ncbi:hypothetical protein IT400_01595 [Candidatus Nomurabacteria bacterium]|nr:hypothetical protein [Candidatus Nomurabacteria bacterium]